MSNGSPWIVGIDLGTTHTVLSYCNNSKHQDETAVHTFAVPQLTGPGTIERNDILPSFILIPDPSEVADEAIVVPWKTEGRMVIGEFARERGAEIPHRLISSAKSWLCHPMVDRNAAILPWQGNQPAMKRSPVEASAAILQHLVRTWNHVRTGQELSSDMGSNRLEDQEIFLTVPASFDALARDLTVKAAAMAGLHRVTLLEEPQAALYAWISDAQENWRKYLKPQDLILVCDIGGGTTDFSLIRVGEEQGNLTLERIAVGNHLMVGGDNMDMTLAYALQGKLAGRNIRLDAMQMRALIQACRKGKERLLSDDAGDTYRISILGKGKGLIAQSISTELTADEVNRILLDGFFPLCELTAAVQTSKTVGLQEIGISYEADPAITHHLAAFLRRHSHGSPLVPTAVLFNGGVMKSPVLRNRLLELLQSWNGGSPLKELPASDFDRSVARGATYYGLSRKVGGIRIRSGLNKTYYIGIAASMPAVPGVPTPVKALCVAGFGMEEGTVQPIPDRSFALLLGERTSFELMASSIRKEDVPGEMVESWDEDIEPVATMETELEGETGQRIPVGLETRATEIGTLELWCISRMDDRKWKLEFNVREPSKSPCSASIQ
uniref:Hsp70 family protein n=1 Tax=Desulfatirhabdium butyrativorans TaxID=340467 RepID=A0A7C4RRJ0_9BACT